MASPPPPNEPIAIIGTACRFPGDASSPSKLWDLLRQPRDVLTKIPEDRFNPDYFYHPDPLHRGTSNVRHSYVLSQDIGLFDAKFFGVKPVEASAIDPQQRLLMETAYEALEAAGIAIDRIHGLPIGVFVGLMGEDYSLGMTGQDGDGIPNYFSTGTFRSIMANRLSYFFDICGPSMTIDTACSSSLVALHQAVGSLRSGESTAALVAGANLLLSPLPYIAHSKLRMLSPHGRSRMWDKDADGYGRGDGFAVLVLKTLSRALADGDSIECLVRETGVNQDGRTKGITMPSSRAQMELIRETYRKAGLDALKAGGRPQYFEAHGTGTQAGDPTEAEAIATSFFRDIKDTSSHEAPLYVGSVKTVIGHTEGTAGLAGVMKVLLALKHSKIPPNMLLEELNPTVLPFYTRLQIPQQTLEWHKPAGGGPRRASVNSFGFGGTNAHVIIDEFVPAWEPPSAHDLTPATSRPSSSDGTSPFLPFLFSASSEESLLQSLSAYKSWLRGEGKTVSLENLSWTLNTRRSTLPVRVSLSANSSEDLVAKLQGIHDNKNGIKSELSRSTGAAPKQPQLLGIFTGQGAQWAAMGATLLQTSRTFSECFSALQHALNTLPPSTAPTWSLVEELIKTSGSGSPDDDASPPGSASRLATADPEISQTLTTAVQIALVDMLQRDAKIHLTAVVGHSSGEIAAAYAAGFISAHDAIRTAYFRGLSVTRPQATASKKGSMLAVGLSTSNAQELCNSPSMLGRICIAAHNSPTSLTLSGDADAIKEAKDMIEAQGKFVRQLRVGNMAYHSHHMVPLSEVYLGYLQGGGSSEVGICNGYQDHQLDIDPSRPNWISSVTGEPVSKTPETLERLQNGSYWRDNMIQPVLFTQAIAQAFESNNGFDGCVEIGPHPTLKTPTENTIQSVNGDKATPIPYIGTLRRGTDDTHAISDTLGSLWTVFGTNASVDFEALYKDFSLYDHQPRFQVVKDLPSYHWDHDRRYWHQSPSTPQSNPPLQQNGHGHGPKLERSIHVPHPLLGRVRPDDIDTGTNEFRFRNFLSPKELPWLQHHRIQGQVIFPAAGYICAVIEAVFRIPWQSTGNKRSNPPFDHYQVDLAEFSDIAIGNALVLPDTLFDSNRSDQYSGVETLLSLQIISQEYNHPDNSQTANLLFTFYSRPHSSNPTASPLVKNASGKLQITLSTTTPTTSQSHLPPPSTPLCKAQSRFINVQPNQFYSAMQKVGYEWEGDFQCIFDAKRTIHEAVGGLSLPDHDETLTLHPGFLDSAVQTVLLAYCYPGDGRLRSVMVPTRIDRVGVDLGECRRVGGLGGKEGVKIPFYSVVDPRSGTPEMDGGELVGDVEIHSVDGERTMVLMQGLRATSLVPAGERDDVKVFLDVEWREEEFGGCVRCFEELEGVIEVLRHRFGDFGILETSAGGECFEESKGRFGLEKVVGEGLRVDSSVLGGFIGSSEHAGNGQSVGEAVYGLVVLHHDARTGTSDVESILTHGRRLLRTGGYILVLLNQDKQKAINNNLEKGSDSSVRSQFVRSQLRSRLEDWNEILQKTGFSGLDMKEISSFLSHPQDQEQQPSPIMLLSQAQDDRVSLLYNPQLPGHTFDTLTILSIDNDQPITQRLATALSPHYQQVQTLSPTSLSRSDTNPPDFPSGGTAICLLGLSSTVDLTDSSTLNSIQKMFSRSRNILWVVSGARSGENPTANMVKGLMRSVVLEIQELSVQFVDFARAGQPDLEGGIGVDIVVKKTLQLEAGGLLKKGSDDNILSTHEPEVFVDEQGMVLIPRFKVNGPRNRRLNAGRRALTVPVAVGDSNLCISPSGEVAVSSYIGSTTKRWDDAPLHNGHIAPTVDGDGFDRLHLVHSLLLPIRITETIRLYLSLGRVKGRDGLVLVVSDSLKSIVMVPTYFIWPLASFVGSEKYAGDNPEILATLAAHLMSLSILESATSGGTIVVLDSDEALADSLSRLASTYGIYLVLLASDPALIPNSGLPWTLVDSKEPTRSLHRKLPAGRISSFVDMSTSERGKLCAANVRGCLRLLPDNFLTQKLDRSDIIGGQAQLNMSSQRDVQEVSFRINNAWSSHIGAISTGSDNQSIQQLTIVGLDYLSSQGHRLVSSQRQVVVSWRADQVVDIREKPASARVSFHPDKTYWLVGLTRGLGLSLAEWMADHGARHLVLSSRQPKVESAWLDGMASSRGCSVRVLASDITNRDSLHKTYHTIKSTMPPISGIAQGAMVLRDAKFLNFDAQRVDEVFKPKVDGSIYLDELFQQHHPLDFFVFFSSVAYITGNSGQGLYAAANAFMTSLVAQRRNKGLAASVIHLGAVTGEGYVSRELAFRKQVALEKGGFDFLSEQTFREVFAEGVLASPCREDGDTGVTTGVKLDDGSKLDTSRYYFSSNPIFQHILPSNQSSELDRKADDKDSSNSSGISIKTQLDKITSVEEVIEIITSGLVSKLAASLQTNLVNTPGVTDAGLDTLGVDSLISGDIQSWFSKEVGVEMPVMKIINATSIHQLAELAQGERERKQVSVAASERTTDAGEVDGAGVVPRKGGSTNGVRNKGEGNEIL